MSEDHWEQEHTLASMARRTLEARIPPLKPYLYPGAKVLDVGCGPGSITLGVAAAVHPGSVVGIDSAEAAVEQAAKLAEEQQVGNVTFQVGDTYGLEFPDETFDITYSHNVLVWIRDPVRALEEQKRVTRRGGWVIGAIADWGTSIVYPPCPALERVWAAAAHLNDPSDPEAFFHANMAREAVALFSRARLEEIRIDGYVASNVCVYPGSESFDHRYEQWRRLADMEGPIEYNRKLFALGVLDVETLRAMKREIDVWHAHPHAFFAETTFLAAGKVP